MGFTKREAYLAAIRSDLKVFMRQAFDTIYPAKSFMDINPSVIVNNMAPLAAAAKKPATARSTATGSKTTDMHPAKSDIRLAAQPVPIAPQLPTEKIRDSKQAKLIAELRAAPGATIKQMMALTGWQAHTIRGTISGVLRKKLGLNVICESPTESGERRYRIINSAVIA